MCGVMYEWVKHNMQPRLKIIGFMDQGSDQGYVTVRWR